MHFFHLLLTAGLLWVSTIALLTTPLPAGEAAIAERLVDSGFDKRASGSGGSGRSSNSGGNRGNGHNNHDSHGTHNGGSHNGGSHNGGTHGGGRGKGDPKGSSSAPKPRPIGTKGDAVKSISKTRRNARVSQWERRAPTEVDKIQPAEEAISNPETVTTPQFRVNKKTKSVELYPGKSWFGLNLKSYTESKGTSYKAKSDSGKSANRVKQFAKRILFRMGMAKNPDGQSNRRVSNVVQTDPQNAAVNHLAARLAGKEADKNAGFSFQPFPHTESSFSPEQAEHYIYGPVVVPESTTGDHLVAKQPSQADHMPVRVQYYKGKGTARIVDVADRSLDAMQAEFVLEESDSGKQNDGQRFAEAMGGFTIQKGEPHVIAPKSSTRGKPQKSSARTKLDGEIVAGLKQAVDQRRVVKAIETRSGPYYQSHVNPDYNPALNPRSEKYAPELDKDNRFYAAPEQGSSMNPKGSPKSKYYNHDFLKQFRNAKALVGAGFGGEKPSFIIGDEDEAGHAEMEGFLAALEGEIAAAEASKNKKKVEQGRLGEPSKRSAIGGKEHLWRRAESASTPNSTTIASATDPSATSTAEDDDASSETSVPASEEAQLQQYIEEYQACQAEVADLIWPVVTNVLSQAHSEMFYMMALSIFSDLTRSTVTVSGPFWMGRTTFDDVEDQAEAGGADDDYMSMMQAVDGEAEALYSAAWKNATDALRGSQLPEAMDALAQMLHVADASKLPKEWSTVDEWDAAYDQFLPPSDRYLDSSLFEEAPAKNVYGTEAQPGDWKANYTQALELLYYGRPGNYSEAIATELAFAMYWDNVNGGTENDPSEPSGGRNGTVGAGGGWNGTATGSHAIATAAATFHHAGRTGAVTLPPVHLPTTLSTKATKSTASSDGAEEADDDDDSSVPAKTTHIQTKMTPVAAPL